MTITETAEVEQDIHPLVLAEQIADLTNQLHVSLTVGGDWGGDYGTLMDHLRATTSHLADCSAQVRADAYDNGWRETRLCASEAEWHLGQAAHWLSTATRGIPIPA